MAKFKKNNFHWLVLAAIFHLFSLFCSVYRDSIYIGIKWPSGYYQEVNYWLTFFSWWCAQASLITIIYFIYKLLKKSKSGYFDKVFDLIVINANIITIGIFTISAVAGLTPLAKSDKPIVIFSWAISSKVFWWFYAIIWHYLAPLLVITYFLKRKVNLANTYFARRKLFLYSFFHPLFYFVFVLVRPLVSGVRTYAFSKESPHYPYFFFNWVGVSDFSHIFWAVVVIFFWLLIFWLSTVFFWWYANCKLKNSGKLKKNLAFSPVSLLAKKK